jgi:hypothetical protein
LKIIFTHFFLNSCFTGKKDLTEYMGFFKKAALFAPCKANFPNIAVYALSPYRGLIVVSAASYTVKKDQVFGR